MQAFSHVLANHKLKYSGFTLAFHIPALSFQWFRRYKWNTHTHTHTHTHAHTHMYTRTHAQTHSLTEPTTIMID